MFSPSRSIRLHSWYVGTAVVVSVSFLSWATGISPFFILHAHAAQLELVSDTLSTSRPGVAANHTITFSTPTGVPADGSTVVVTIPTGFDTSLISEDDIDVLDDGVDLTTDTICGSTEAAVSVSGQEVIIQICNGGTGEIVAGSVLTIKIGTNAVQSGVGANRIINHQDAGTYQLGVAGTMADQGATNVAIVESAVITGQVDTYLDFYVLGVNEGEVVNGDATLTSTTTTATSVAFGTIVPGTEYLLAQDLFVTTNAREGFTVTVAAAGDLESSSGATIESFFDGTDAPTPIAWDAPDTVIGSPDTYGHWGITTQDTTLSDNDSFGEALYVGNFINNPREIMFATTSADGSTPDTGTTRVGYKLQISTMQEAASDYTTTLTYVVTPVF